jgi:hypothetical protein
MNSPSATRSAITIRDALVRALRAAAQFNPIDLDAPVAILWPDSERVWSQVAETLGRVIPLVSLGPYDAESGTGPAMYLRLAVAEHQRKSGGESEFPLLVYLPGLSRRQLVDTETLAEELRPLGGLIVRSAFFAQKNGADWTPLAFFANSSTGLNLKVANDRETKDALRRFLPRLLDVEVADLRGRDLTSTELAGIAVDDPVREILLWLDDPERFQREATAEGGWPAFVGLLRAKYGIDPEEDGPLLAGQRLGDRLGSWSGVWTRFADSPQSFPGIPALLRRAMDDGQIPLHSDSWPQENEEAESAAFAFLADMASQPIAIVRQRLSELSKANGSRLTSVWSKLGLTPAAETVEQLNSLATATTMTAPGNTVSELAEHYASTGREADDLFMRSLRSLQPGHPSAKDATKVAEALYRPWLEATVTSFQNVWQSMTPDESLSRTNSGSFGDGTCIVFVDGLRYDLAVELAQELDQQGLQTKLEWSLAAVPTVTSTCKPAVSPVAHDFTAGPELAPQCTGGQSYSQDQLKRALDNNRWAFIPADSEGNPAGRGWLEGGDIDNLGHSLGAKLAHQLPSQVSAIRARVSELVAAGWQVVKVVTDHGWILLPGKLPKTHLPEHLTVKRKGRCARLTDAAVSPPGLPVLPWRWDPQVRIVVAPGIHAFEDGKVYEHGGISPQESVVPVLTVTTPAPSSKASQLSIDVSWAGLAVQVECGSAPEGAIVDVRARAADPETSLINRPKALKDGKVRLMAGDEHEGSAAFVVVLGAGNQLLGQQLTHIPEG